MTRLIDADELKAKVRQNFDNLQAYFPSQFLEEIDNAPTVERPQGKWLYEYPIEVCSICKGEALDVNDYPYKSNFCPHCGADMRGHNHG